MANIRCPSPLDAKIWIRILRHSDQNPLELKKLAGIKTGKKNVALGKSRIVENPKSLAKKALAVRRRNDAFLAPLAAAAIDDSLMRAYSPIECHENGKLLQGFFTRLDVKDSQVQQQIKDNYSRRIWPKKPFEPLNDFDLAISFAATRGVFPNVPPGKKAWLSMENKEIRANRITVFAAVKKYGCALQYASADLRNDKEIVLAAVIQHGRFLQYASAELRNNKEVVLVAVKKFGWALQYVSANLRNNKEVVLAAVRQAGWSLQYVSTELRNDEEVVLAAVKQDEWALRYASSKLKNDKIFVFVATRQNEIVVIRLAAAAVRIGLFLALIPVRFVRWAFSSIFTAKKAS